MIKEVKNKKEYIELIDKENLLSIPSLEYISGKKFKNLVKQTQKSDILFDTLNNIKSTQNRLNRQEKNKNKKP